MIDYGGPVVAVANDAHDTRRRRRKETHPALGNEEAVATTAVGGGR